MLELLLNEAFIQRALLAAFPIGMLTGIIGTLTVAKRIIYISGSLSHAIFGGIALGLFLEAVYPLPNYAFINLPFLGAFLVASICAVLIAFFATYQTHKKDVLLSLLWTAGIAGGIIFLSKSNYITTRLNTLLFGDLFLITPTELILIFVLLIIALSFISYYYATLQLIILDPIYATLKDISSQRLNFFIILIISYVIAALTPSIGVTMIIALFSLSAATAASFTTSLAYMFFFSSLLNIIYLICGILLSIVLDLPVTPAVVIIAGSVYFCTESFNYFRKQGLT